LANEAESNRKITRVQTHASAHAQARRKASGRYK
jgi:hypothetical protein